MAERRLLLPLVLSLAAAVAALALKYLAYSLTGSVGLLSDAGESILAAVLSLSVALVLLRVGRAHRSVVLEADGHHWMTDVWTSLGVVAGLGLVWLTGIQALDPLVALAVAVNIGWTGGDLVRI